MSYTISTITASGTFGEHSVLRLNDIAQELSLDNKIIGIKGQRTIKGVYKTSNKKESTKSFYNQVSLRVVLQEKEYNIKLFRNGSIHLTGVKDQTKINDIINEIRVILEKMNVEKEIVLLGPGKCDTFIDSYYNLYSSDKKNIIGYVQNNRYNINNKWFVYDSNVNLFISEKQGTGRENELVSGSGNVVGHTKIILNSKKLYKNKGIFYDKQNLNMSEEHPFYFIYHESSSKSTILGKVQYILNYPINDTPSPNIKEKAITYKYHYHAGTIKNNTNYKINCINIYFSIGSSISRLRLISQLKKDNHSCEYNPERYSGIKWYITPEVTLLIFCSGNIIGSGFKDPSAIQDIVNYVHDYISQNSFIKYMKM